MKMPVLFVGHGSPMNAIESNRYTEMWRTVVKDLKPEAILMVSAHWFTGGSRAQDDPSPRKINDMYGFPDALYTLRYDVKGSPWLTDAITALLGSNVKIDNTWGIDHGSWSVLCHMFPEADVPVVQLSVDRTATPAEKFDLGRRLHALRDKGILIIGSGNIVHNLRLVNPGMEDPFDWAKSFDESIQEAISNGDFRTCIDYEKLGEAARLSVPTTDHYDPLLYVLGAADEEDEVTIFNAGYQFGSVSMTSYLFEQG